MSTNRRRGFTLIEVLIVVVIMAVLAATIIPQFSVSTKDAKQSTLDFNLHSLRSQIEMYRMHHLGKYPTLDAGTGTLPELLTTTNAAGQTGTGTAYPYGPYLVGGIPKNPFNDSEKVVAGTGGTQVAGGAGWQYNATTGQIWPNNDEAFE